MIAYNTMILNLSLATQILQILLMLAFVVITIRQDAREWIHKTMVVGVVMILVVTIAVEWDAWLI